MERADGDIVAQQWDDEDGPRAIGVSTALRLIITLTSLIAMCALGVWLVRRAKRGGGTGALGAAMLMFSWGHMRDPGNDPVAEAQDGRIRKGESTGDPPA